MARLLCKMPPIAKPSIVEPSIVELSRFIALPTEIRLQIYGYLFDGARIDVGLGDDCGRPCTLIAAPEPGMLMCCRLCHEEGLDTLWSQATWVFSREYNPFKPLLLKTFLGTTAHQRRLQLVKHVEVSAFWYLSRQDFRQLPNLKTFTIKINNFFFSDEPKTEGGSIDVLKLHDDILNSWPHTHVVRYTKEATEDLHIQLFGRMTFFWDENHSTGGRQHKLECLMDLRTRTFIRQSEDLIKSPDDSWTPAAQSPERGVLHLALSWSKRAAYKLLGWTE